MEKANRSVWLWIMGVVALIMLISMMSMTYSANAADHSQSETNSRKALSQSEKETESMKPCVETDKDCGVDYKGPFDDSSVNLQEAKKLIKR